MNNIDTNQLDKESKRVYWNEVVENFLSSGQNLKQYTIWDIDLDQDQLGIILQPRLQIEPQMKILASSRKAWLDDADVGGSNSGKVNFLQWQTPQSISLTLFVIY